MRHAVLLLLVAPLAAACSDAANDPTAVTPEPALSALHDEFPARATGHWEFTPWFAEVAKYSANAIKAEDGSVTGQFQVREVYDSETTTILHGEVVCMTTFPDGTARVGGIVTNETGTDFGLAGTEAVWMIQDNGEGRKSPPDMATDIRYGYPAGSGAAQAFCDGWFFPTNPPFVMFPVERGNVQVHHAGEVPLPG